jgi:cell fate regulator YaaT (PSP1 superfamily)
MEVFDWLAGIPLADGMKPFDVVEVRFKNGRKAFFRKGSLELFQGDVVAVEASTGYDVGIVSLAGELVRVQMNRRDIKDNYELKRVLRKAEQSDFDTWQAARQLETSTMIRAREISRDLGLQMKISDVEYQGDKTRAIFYYTADDRVDFRELIRKYAEEFKVRIEMRQIGLRLEAGRLGGIGSCGRELCCSTWLTDFRSVSTGAARYQQLSLNPGKLAGQCGKLKCCLNYELDQYVEAVRMLPPTHVKLKLPKGIATHFKTDIFKQVIYYTIEGQHGEGPFALSADVVKDIIEKNKRGEVIGEVQTFIEEKEVVESVEFAEVVGQDSLTRFDNKKRKPNNNNRNRNKPNNSNKPAAPGNTAPQNAGAPKSKEGNRPQANGNRPNRFKGKPNNPNPNQGKKE